MLFYVQWPIWFLIFSMFVCVSLLKNDVFWNPCADCRQASYTYYIFAGKRSSAHVDQLGLLEGPLFVAAMLSCTTAKHNCLDKHKLSTPLLVRTQNHRGTKLSSCGTGTSNTHGDFAWHVATRPCTCTDPDCQLRIHRYMQLQCYSWIQIVALEHMYIQFTPVIHVTAGELNSCP